MNKYVIHISNNGAWTERGKKYFDTITKTCGNNMRTFPLTC